MQIIKPDPQLIENTKTALRILETCAKAAATALTHSSFPAVLVAEGDGEKVRPMEPGEIVEVPAPGGPRCTSQIGRDSAPQTCALPSGHEGSHENEICRWDK